MAERKKVYELRVVLFDGERHALYYRVTISGSDIYTGSAQQGMGELFRSSYHASGQKHLRLLRNKISQGRGIPPIEIKGAVQVDAASSSLGSLDWSYTPKRETSNRRYLLIDLRSLAGVPSFTAELFALEPERPGLVDEALSRYRAKGRILGQLHLTKTEPELLMFVWTLTPEGWEALARARGTTAQPPITEATVRHAIENRAILTYQAITLADFIDRLQNLAPIEGTNAPPLAVALGVPEELAEGELPQLLRDLRDELRRLNEALENTQLDERGLGRLRDASLKLIDNAAFRTAVAIGAGGILVTSIAGLLDHAGVMSWDHFIEFIKAVRG